MVSVIAVGNSGATLVVLECLVEAVETVVGVARGLQAVFVGEIDQSEGSIVRTAESDVAIVTAFARWQILKATIVEVIIIVTIVIVPKGVASIVLFEVVDEISHSVGCDKL